MDGLDENIFSCSFDEFLLNKVKINFIIETHIIGSSFKGIIFFPNYIKNFRQ